MLLVHCSAVWRIAFQHVFSGDMQQFGQPDSITTPVTSLSRILDIPMYSVDALVATCPGPCSRLKMSQTALSISIKATLIVWD